MCKRFFPSISQETKIYNLFTVFDQEYLNPVFKGGGDEQGTVGKALRT